MSSKVLASLKQSGSAPVKPFALQSQYVPNIMAAREGSGGDGEDGGQKPDPQVPKSSQESQGKKRIIGMAICISSKRLHQIPKR